MKRISLFFLHIFAVSLLSLSAQSKMEQMVTTMQTTFDLTADQTEEVRTILNETAQEMQGIRQLRKTDRQAFRKARRPIMQNMESKLLTVLDDTQAEQFRQMRQNSNRKGQGQGRTVAGASAPTISTDKTEPISGPETEQTATEEESYTESSSTDVEESWEETDTSGTDSYSTSTKEDMLEKTLDFLYEGFLRPAVQNRKRKN